MKIFVTILTFFLFYNISGQTGWQQLGQTITGKTSFESSGSSVSTNGLGDVIAIGEPGVSTLVIETGRVRVYRLSNGDWRQLGEALTGGNESDFFGRRVSLSSDGKVLAVSGYGNNGLVQGKGFIRIYDWNGTDWKQRGKDIIGQFPKENLGQSLEINGRGNVLIVGATHNQNKGRNTGTARVYRWSDNEWIQVGTDFYGLGKDDYYGYSVEINYKGNIIAISALGSNDSISSSRVETYAWKEKSWVQLGDAIKGMQPGENAANISLDSSGKILAVGSSLRQGEKEGSGQVKVYKFTIQGWTIVGHPITDNTSEELGSKVSLNAKGTILMVKAYVKGGGGLCKVITYELKNEEWVLYPSEILGRQIIDDFFGSSIDINAQGSVVVIGAYGSNSNGQLAGETRVFQNIKK